MTSAALLALLGFGGQALALALGAASVKSYLGEPLRAEIEIPEITSQEAATFKANMGSPQVFQTAGVTYSADLAGTRISLHRRANGQAYLRVEGVRPINEPFLGIVIEADWSAGHVVRDYTMLIDPANHAPTAVTPPQVSPARQPAVATQVQKPSAEPGVHAPPRTGAASAGGGQQVTVRRGDTANGILKGRVPEGVSLDQMLLALQRTNPNAFIHGNVNLIKAGAVLNLPSAEQADAMTSKQARQAVRLQTRNFLEYRHTLAANATPAAPAKTPGLSSTGSVQPQVKVNTQTSSPDVLHVGSGTPSGGATETATAIGRQQQAQTARQTEIAQNTGDLTGILKGASNPPPVKQPPASTPAAAVPGGINVPAGSPAQAPQVTPAASAPPVVPEPSAAASQPSETATTTQESVKAPPTPSQSGKKPPAVTPPPPPPAPESSWLPIIGWGALAIAVLGGGGFFLLRPRKKKAASADSMFAPSQAQPDSFFANSGGQQVDTTHQGSASRTGASSLVYSPSQLDAAGDVDPVAEADVYLAYGRDMQAEEILKEALRTHPGRPAVYRKLAEIYSKRRDVKALEALATEAHGITNGAGPDWEFIAGLGHGLDPDNPMYATGGKPQPQKPASPVPTTRHAFGAETQPYTTPPPAVESKDSAMDLDLDLDTPAQAAPPPAAPAPAPAASTRTPAPAREPIKPTEPAPLDFDLSLRPQKSTAAAKPQSKATPTRVETPSGKSNSSMIDFDMNELSVNPDSRSGGHTRQPGVKDDPMSTKLALAQEFHAIGDTEGARTLLKEVIAQSEGAVKEQAERFMSELD
ncbi:MAG: hypothetical protein LBI48_04195 [Burkholderiaceae bacterium]|nr:hypothetical protein [Burkholderiaceae bacterium]